MFTVTVNDQNGGTVTQDVTVVITGSNDVPTLTATDVGGVILEGTTLSDSGSIAFADLDLTDRPTATEATKSVTALKADGTSALTLTDGQQQAIEDAFSISAAGGNTNDGTINWTYTITEAELNFLAKGEVVTAVFTVTVNDQNGGTVTQDVTVVITGSNDAPVITDAGSSATFRVGKSAVLIDSSLSITDPDNTDLTSASITISAGFNTGDTLIFVDQDLITASYDEEKGILTLSGMATKQQYETALESIKFSTTSTITGNRTISWVVSDGTNESAATTSTVAVATNSSPTVSGLQITANAITFIASDADGDALSFNTPFSGTVTNAYPSGTTTSTLSVSQQTGNILEGEVKITDGDATAAVGLYVAMGTGSGDKLDASKITIPAALYGFDGNDTLTGGSGDDWLFGGLGSDRFVFAGTNTYSAVTINNGSDTISGFKAGEADGGDILDFFGAVTGTLSDTIGTEGQLDAGGIGIVYKVTGSTFSLSTNKAKNTIDVDDGDDFIVLFAALDTSTTFSVYRVYDSDSTDKKITAFSELLATVELTESTFADVALFNIA